MTESGKVEALDGWLEVPGRIEAAIAGLTTRQLDLRGGPEQWSVREIVHHLVEANLVASTIMLAALGSSGCTFDWSWLNPNTTRNVQMSYDTLSLKPAIELLKALSRHIGVLIAARTDAYDCNVKLFDAPGAPTYTMTVEQVLRQEIDHAGGHLREVRTIRRKARTDTERTGVPRKRRT